MHDEFSDDPPIYLGLQEAPAHFVSGSQKARVWTEQWARDYLFCPNCGADGFTGFANNRPVADFFCRACDEEFELKSQKNRFSSRVVNGAFKTMCARLAARNNPNLMLLTYDLASFSVTNALVVPKHFFVQAIIEERPPLAATARRAGWVGCNILLGRIPDAGKIYLVRNSQALSRTDVQEKWRDTLFLRRQGPAARGWLMDVLQAVESISRAEFTLADVYLHEDHLQALHPSNRNVRPKIRQQLQVLRDEGVLEFTSPGNYRIRRAR